MLQDERSNVSSLLSHVYSTPDDFRHERTLTRIHVYEGQ